MAEKSREKTNFAMHTVAINVWRNAKGTDDRAKEGEETEWESPQKMKKKNIQKPFSFIFLTASVVAITISRQLDDDEKMKREKQVQKRG